ncbi:DUF6316 family protein [Thiohalophilus sp.]|uniref:DUF6316 family protein n=1 Tax=Thiohalophilus sp. TaxID=3028392 RepID=UPI002ACDE00B|nr:DUF6316 family protein [Thiohalophilus sp.]MDZ7661426.1 DUF6316 family protein [Thiohalophilus sp.]
MYRFDDEKEQAPVRSERFYEGNGEWFFAVRKGPDRGPFASKEEARAALRTYIVEQLAEEKHRHPSGRRFWLRSPA